MIVSLCSLKTHYIFFARTIPLSIINNIFRQECFMVFSSIYFLFYFLPIVIILYFSIPHKTRNLFLLLVSLFFYAWEEGVYLLLMISVVLVNYCIGLAFQKWSGKTRKMFLSVGVVLNLIPLFFYKYSEFFITNTSHFLGSISLPQMYSGFSPILPLGISFFTFQAMSYLIDTYKRTTPVQTNPINLGLYIALFPQLIAGPIVRYHDISKQIKKRTITFVDFSYGVERFIFGLGKKVLIANPLGQMADIIFALPADQLSTATAWLGAVCYMLQIYYDFSGYSDMAIGLGRMFGFTFLENFNYPYISRSIQEFWQRWHISLSNWFRDYLYIPLGGNRKGGNRTIFNLFVVFLLCGLWHGASWNFVLWGLFHGTFLAFERGNFGTLLRQRPIIIRHAYTLFVVMIGWVLFRTETLPQAKQFLAAIFGNSDASTISYEVVLHFDALFITTILCALFFMCPIFPYIKNWMKKKENTSFLTSDTLMQTVKIPALSFIFLLAASALATGVYNPFIYFRF